MINNPDAYNHYVNLQHDYLYKWYPMIMAFTESTSDLMVVQQAMELTRTATIFPMGLWKSLKRIRNEAHGMKLSKRADIRFDLDWGQEVEDHAEWLRVLKIMTSHQKFLREWDSDFYRSLASKPDI